MAVSAALMISAFGLINGQQAKTEFSQSTRDIDSQVRDIMNNVASGYYARPDNFSCLANVTGPLPSLGGTTEVGGNNQCIFMGRAIQFGVHGSNGKDFNVYNIIGNRVAGGPPTHIVTNFTEAQPTVLTGSGGLNTTEHRTLKYQLSVGRMYYTNGGIKTDIGTVGFFTSLGEADFSTGDTLSGAQNVEIRPVLNTAINTDDETAATNAIDVDNGTNLSIVPDGGVTICFNSAGTDQHADVLMGGNSGSSGRSTGTTLTIGNGPCT